MCWDMDIFSGRSTFELVMALRESMQACCPFCGISFTNFEFHLNLHEDCKLMDGQSEQVGERREEMILLSVLIILIVIDLCSC